MSAETLLCMDSEEADTRSRRMFIPVWATTPQAEAVVAGVYGMSQTSV